MRILVVEDNPALAEGLLEILKGNGYSVDSVRDGIEAEAAVAANSFDLVILDLSLPGMDGLGVLRSVRARGDRTPILVLTARGGLDDRVKGLDLGADDYMNKPFEVRELEARIRVLLRRRAGLVSSTIRLGPLHLDLGSGALSIGGDAIDLPRRELSILTTMLMAKGRVLPKQGLMESLSQFEDEISENAVEQYVSRLRRKLAPHGITIRVARGIGYFLEHAEK